jgi:Tfp pilus assembly protein PilX
MRVLKTVMESCVCDTSMVCYADALCVAELLTWRAAQVFSEQKRTGKIQDEDKAAVSAAAKALSEGATAVMAAIKQLQTPPTSCVQTDVSRASSRLRQCRKALAMLGDAAWVVCGGEGGRIIDATEAAS